MSSQASLPSSSRQTPQNNQSSRWIFTQEQLLCVPSIKEGMSPEEEMKNRRAAAHTIHQMADRLNQDSRVRISQLCICAAMMHMHRFFVFHSFYKFDPRDIAAACLFLAGKSEECPRKLEHVVRVWWAIKFPHTPTLDQTRYHDAAQLIVTLENVILQTIAFDLSVEIPHPFVLTQMQNFARGNRRISEIAYWFASDMLHMTNWGVRYTARSIACACIHMACLWADFEIPIVPGSSPWFEVVDPTMTSEKLIELNEEFSHIYKTYGELLSIKKYRSLMRDSPGNSQRRHVANASAQNPPLSLSNLPPPPPAPMLAPSMTAKVEMRTEPTRKIDINDYRQRSGTSTPMGVGASAGSSSSSAQRKNFMQPDGQSASAPRGVGDIDLPPLPALAPERKAQPGMHPDQEARLKRKAEEHERDPTKHRRVDKAFEGSAVHHRKRGHERSSSVAVSGHEASNSIAMHHANSTGVPSAHSGFSSGSRSGIEGTTPKKPKQSAVPFSLAPPPLPPSQGSSAVAGVSSSRASSQMPSGTAAYRNSSYGSDGRSHSSAISGAPPNLPNPSSGQRPHIASSFRSKSSRDSSMAQNAPHTPPPPPPPPAESSNGGAGHASTSPSSTPPAPPPSFPAYKSKRALSPVPVTPPRNNSFQGHSSGSRLVLPPPPLPPANDELEDGELL